MMGTGPCGACHWRPFTHPDTVRYNRALDPDDRAIGDLLAREIDRGLPDAESKIWHAHPVWFLDGNPIVGYSKLKDAVRLLFWSGQSFDEKGLKKEGSFKAAEARYTATAEVKTRDLKRWLAKAREIQWDYHEAAPDVMEECKWKKAGNPLGVPTWSHGGIICTGESYKDKVKLTFARGAALPDPAELFNASLEGNTRRAIDIRDGERLDARAFKALIRAAVAEHLRSSA
jgi:hypothetical protein